MPAFSPLTTPPDPSAPANTLNSVSASAPERSRSSRPKRRSGPVGAEARERLVVAQALQRQLDPGAAHLLQNVGDEPLVYLEDVFGLDERHLDVELGEVGLAVRALVLVAKAPSDLVVALEATHHEELLEELRRLRQRIEGSGLTPRGDQEVAGAFRRRAREDGSLDLKEALRVEELAHRPSYCRPGCDGALERLTAEVEIAMAKSHLLPHLAREALDLKRRRVGVRKLVGRSDPDFELAGRHLRVDRLLGAPDDRSRHRDHILGAEGVPQREGLSRLVGVKYELNESGAVAKVHEDDAPVVAPAVDPPGYPHVGAHRVFENPSAPGVAVAVGFDRRKLAH